MNCYRFEQTTRGNIKMNGALGENDRFIVSEAYEIQEGDRITFGPVRPMQPVMGYFFDEEQKPLALINHTNIEIAHTFKEGMVMASVLAPKGAAAVRLQLTIAEKDLFCVFINEEICQEELPSERYLGNPLKGQNVLTVGDSLCAAAKDTKIDGMRGWARRIREEYDANVFNAGIGGAALSVCRMSREKATEWHHIYKQFHRFKGYDYDFILMEGGGNDCWDKAPIGEISESFDPDSFDQNTYVGGLELLFYTAVKKYGDTAALGYMSLYKTPHFFKTLFINEYFEVGKKVCEKWGIPYLDMYNELEVDTVQYTVDGIHAHEGGYNVMGPYINSFMKKLQPISKEVYEKVNS